VAKQVQTGAKVKTRTDPFNNLNALVETGSADSTIADVGGTGIDRTLHLDRL